MKSETFEERLQNAFTMYQDFCMEQMNPDVEHVFSNSYQKKIKRILWSQKKFGNHVKGGLVIRKIAAAIVLLALLGVSSVGAVHAAQKLGWIDGWNFHFIGQNDDGEYQFKAEKGEDAKVPQAIKNVEPTYLAKGLVEKERQDKSIIMSGVRWSKNDEQAVELVRWLMDDKSTFNAENMPEEVDKYKIKGHEMTVYEFEPGMRTVMWIDQVSHTVEGQEITSDYLFQMTFDQELVPQKEIKKMIKSMYES